MKPGARSTRRTSNPASASRGSPDALDHKAVIRGSAGIYYGPLVYADYGQGTVQGFTVQGNLFTADPLDGVPLDSGLQALSTSPDLDPNQLDGTQTSADYVAKSNGRPGMVENWALETQYQIKPHLFATLGYLGNHATHLHAMLDFFNDMPDKDMALGDWLNWWACRSRARRLERPADGTLLQLHLPGRPSHLHLGVGRL